MKPIKTDILIIGAGLSGLCLAYYLRTMKIKVSLVEGRSRPGGRIYTLRDKGASLEMGATWLGPQHSELQKLLKELNLDIFKQELGATAIYEAITEAPHQIVALPPHQEVSYRIKGGTSRLIEALMEQLINATIAFDCVVNYIEQKESNLLVSTSKGAYSARFVVSTLPPFLFKETIQTRPDLPASFDDIAVKTHTWMGESIKIGLRYQEDFWHNEGMSSTIFSNRGPITEMYDHSNAETSEFALKGFIGSNYFSLTKAQRLEMILDQLEKYYGPQARDYMDYQEVVWQKEALTFRSYDEYLFPHQNNGNEIFRVPYLNSQLFISGSETANRFPGYMEGAVRSAHWVSNELKRLF